MSELVKTNQGVVEIQPSVSQAVVNLFDPLQFETMQRVCKMFASSELVPDMYKASDKNPVEKAIANCMIAIEIAQRIGASPLMVMQNMVPIYGKPSWSSKFLIATVNTSGRFNPLQYRFTERGMLGMVDYTDYEWQSGRKVAVQKQFDGKKIMDVECVAYTTAKGSDQTLESSPVSIRLAVQEGWYTKNGSKWQTMTKQMLMYRAASFWTSAYAPELSMGMRTVEEQQDIYTDFEEVRDVRDEVAKEIDDNANKSVLGFSPEQTAQGNESGMTADTETGEVKEDAKKPNKPEEPIRQQRKVPGF